MSDEKNTLLDDERWSSKFELFRRALADRFSIENDYEAYKAAKWFTKSKYQTDRRRSEIFFETYADEIIKEMGSIEALRFIAEQMQQAYIHKQSYEHYYDMVSQPIDSVLRKKLLERDIDLSENNPQIIIDKLISRIDELKERLEDVDEDPKTYHNFVFVVSYGKVTIIDVVSFNAFIREKVKEGVLPQHGKHLGSDRFNLWTSHFTDQRNDSIYYRAIVPSIFNEDDDEYDDFWTYWRGEHDDYLGEFTEELFGMLITMGLMPNTKSIYLRFFY